MELAGSTGLEPAASGVTGRRSNQLNYDPEELMPLTAACQGVRLARQPERRRREGWWAVQDSNL